MSATATTGPAVFGITGWSGSGKTALIVALIPEFRRRGYRVATIKHAHHDFDIDKPEKDSHKHRTAGATETVISSANRWAIVHENRGAPEPALPDLIARLSPTDIVLVEGYKSHPHPKIEVYRPSMGAPLLCAENSTIRAVASDAPVEGAAVPVIDLNDPADVTAFILSQCGLDERLTGVV
jgi:molybdopterin-guanine dinucleotide biosynthesis protein B